MWVLVSQVPHSVGTSGSIWLTHVSWATNNELDLVVEFYDDMLSNVKNEMNTLLSCDSADKCEKRDGIIDVLEMEVLLLEFSLCNSVIGSHCIQFSDSFRNWDTIREGEWLRFLSQKPA